MRWESPESELGGPPDRISDPKGHGPNIWFQVVPDGKKIKNRIHLDINASKWRHVPMDDLGAISLEVRKQRVDAEAGRLAALGATLVGVLYEEGMDHYAIAMTDPEGNEFDIN